jgi:catechol 2,3-dioxygenase-like lactoylglutathione lyase family enzyme
MKVHSAVPVIATDDVVETVRYFEDVLGFEKEWVWGDPPVYAGLKAGEGIVYVNYDPDLAETIEEDGLAPEIFLWVERIEEVYDQHRRNGAEIIEELSERPWKAKQYVVLEPNGYRIKIAEDLS